MLELLERGAQQQVGTAEDEPFDSYFSGNTIQICPVGALTSAAYRFRSRPFDLVSVPATCEHCASGCSLRTDYRREVVTRRLAWDEPSVNEEWNCDKGRFAFVYQTEGRIEYPLIRENGELRVASWPEAIAAAARGLAEASSHAVLVGGRSTVEDAYAYARFARVALRTDDIDFRARGVSDEEHAFLASRVAGSPVSVSYVNLESAPIVLLVSFEPEDESPIVFLRLRKAARAGTRVVSVGAVRSKGSEKVAAEMVWCAPGDEATALTSLPADVVDALSTSGAVIMVGERAALSAGALSAVAALADRTGAALAWVPRRAGERGALDAGAVAGLLPGGRPLSDPQARTELATLWGVDTLPNPGVAGDALIDRLHSVGAAVVGGVELSDYPQDVRAALEQVGFIVSLENHHSTVTELASVVLPVAVVTEKAGTFLDWEGRQRPFTRVLRDALTMSDAQVIGMIADAMDRPVGHSDVNALRAELGTLGPWRGARTESPRVPAGPRHEGLVLASWRQLLDSGVMQEGEPHLAATARPTVAKLSGATASRLGLRETATLHGPAGMVTLPVEIADVAESVVWVPMNSPGCHIYRDLGARPGDTIRVTVGGAL
jgi:NADH-quinone oxidoreductase subunit G